MNIVVCLFNDENDIVRHAFQKLKYLHGHDDCEQHFNEQTGQFYLQIGDHWREHYVIALHQKITCYIQGWQERDALAAKLY